VNVLFLTHRLPYAPNRGDRARSFQIARLLAPRVNLEVVSLVHDEQEASQADRVRELGARVSVLPVPRWRNRLKAVPQLAGSRPLTHLLLDAPAMTATLESLVAQRAPDVVLAYCSGMARFALAQPLRKFPLVIDLVDVDSAKWAALLTGRSWPMRWIYQREAHRLSTFEHEAVMHARHTVVVNQREADLLVALAPQASIGILPNGVDVGGLAPTSSPGEAPHLVFCGVMNYAPNVDAVRWFARDIWPRIRAKRPDARFTIVGSDPVDAVRRLASPESGIAVTGWVPDVRGYLWNAAVSVAPLKTARGIQNKVLEAIAAGLPAVITSQVSEGLPPEVRSACRVADTPAGFADETLTLLQLSAIQRRAISASADLHSLSWDHQLEPLHQILESAAKRR
jgi:sugar transferase (PEP-CTERM/EpsH1 system associated)